jgi:predicted RNA binding protein YcfA (HicA-like mRNA interferase family)
MGKLTPKSASEVFKALEKVGFQYLHQRGSHIILVRKNPKTRVSVPNKREIRTGTLRSIIRQAGLTLEEFLDLL